MVRPLRWRVSSAAEDATEAEQPHGVTDHFRRGPQRSRNDPRHTTHVSTAVMRRRDRPDANLDRPSLGVNIGWSRVAKALVRSLVTVALLTVAYFLLPLDGLLSAHETLLLVVSLLIFAVVVAWQVRSILGARYPMLQAIETFSLVIPLFLFAFAVVYYELARGGHHVFTQPLSRLDALYFTVTVFSTVGFGDITPVSETARSVATFQMIADLIVLGLVIRAVASAVKLTREHRAVSASGATATPETPG
jgi:voltage-gated potassium channel